MTKEQVASAELNYKLASDTENLMDEVKSLKEQLNSLKEKLKETDENLVNQMLLKNDLDKEKCTLLLEKGKLNEQIKSLSDKYLKCKREKQKFKDQLSQFIKNSEIAKYIITDDNDKTIAWIQNLQNMKTSEEQAEELAVAVRQLTARQNENKVALVKHQEEIAKKEKKILTLNMKLDDLDKQYKLIKAENANYKDMEVKYNKL